MRAAFSQRAVPYAAAFAAAPFLLQALGLQLVPKIGKGLCGAAFDPTLLPTSDGFYARIFLILISLELAYAFVLYLLRLYFAPGGGSAELERTVYRTGQLIAVATVLLFAVTRTVGLPFYGPFGWAWGGPAPSDPLSIALLTLNLALAVVLHQLAGATRAS